MVDQIIDHWWFNQSPPLPLSRRQEWGWKFQSSSHLVRSIHNQPPSFMTHLVSINSDVAESSYIFMNKKDTPLSPTTQKITRVLKAFKQGTKTKHIFYVISQYFTYIISLNLHYKPMREVLLWLIPIFRWGNRCLKSWRSLLQENQVPTPLPLSPCLSSLGLT